jgi:CHAD domain-containing protein
MRAYFNRQQAFFREQYAVASRFLLTEAIHDMRVSLKRLRTFFDLIEAVDPRFKAKWSFGPARRLFQAAGAVRNLQVLEARVRQASSGHGLDLSEFYNWLKEGELREGRAFRLACRRFDPAFFGSAWKKIAAGLEGLTFLRIRSASEARLTDLLAGLGEATPEPRTVRRLHFIRIRSKEARYTLEIVRGDGADDGDAAVIDKLLRGVHQPLGRWHDDEVVLAALREFRRDRAAGPLFSHKSFVEFSRLTKTSEAANLAEFETGWRALSQDLAARLKKPVPRP